MFNPVLAGHISILILHAFSGTEPEKQCIYFNIYTKRYVVTILIFVHSTCNRGNWECSEDTCASTCQVVGALHYSTFDDLRYDLEGKTCYYDLVRVCILSGDI